MSIQQVPAGFNAEEADNFEDVCTLHLPSTHPLDAPRPSLSSPSLTPPTQCAQIEKQFAVKAVVQMQTYWSILEKVKGSNLRLTKMDDDILEHLQRDFPDFDPAETIDEDKMKSKEGKEKWRNFMMAYEKKVDDYNFGTILRSNPKFEYGEKETIFGPSPLPFPHRRPLLQADSAAPHPVPRMQFYAVEIARYVLTNTILPRNTNPGHVRRNRKGLNDWIYEEAQKEAQNKA